MKTKHLPDLVLQQPSQAQQLILLFHGVGAQPRDMAPLGMFLAEGFPQAAIIAVASPFASDSGIGYQWFSVQGITEENRSLRIAAVMDTFIETVRHWQRVTGTGTAQTALIGFSQGAIMLLEAIAGTANLASRVISLSGRFARLPEQIDNKTTIHLIHGKEDKVISYEHAVQAAYRLRSLGTDVTAEVIPFLGHAIDGNVAELVLHLLQNHLPQRVWDEVLQRPPGAVP